MSIITISGLSIQSDCFNKGDKQEAMDIIRGINGVISGLSGEPQIIGACDIDISQIDVKEDEEDEG